MIKTALFILILLFIVRMIAFFAGSETAYLSITRIKLRQMVRAKKKNAKTAEKLRNNMDELLTVILIGINFLNTLGSSLATAIAISIAGNSGVGIATFIFTFLSVTHEYMLFYDISVSDHLLSQFYQGQYLNP